jgi:hypothetical protein
MPIAVLSSEDFEYLHAKPAALERLRESLRKIGYTAKVITYLRPQEEYAVSLYSELLKHGLERSLDDFLETIITDGEFTHRDTWIYQFRYSRLLDPFASICGAENVIARRFLRNRASNALLEDFVGVIHCEGAPIPFKALVLPDHMNPTVGNGHAESTRELRGHFSADNFIVRERYGVDLS